MTWGDTTITIMQNGKKVMMAITEEKKMSYAGSEEKLTSYGVQMKRPPG